MSDNFWNNDPLPEEEFPASADDESQRTRRIPRRAEKKRTSQSTPVVNPIPDSEADERQDADVASSSSATAAPKGDDGNDKIEPALLALCTAIGLALLVLAFILGKHNGSNDTPASPSTTTVTTPATVHEQAPPQIIHDNDTVTVTPTPSTSWMTTTATATQTTTVTSTPAASTTTVTSTQPGTTVTQPNSSASASEPSPSSTPTVG